MLKVITIKKIIYLLYFCMNINTLDSIVIKRSITGAVSANLDKEVINGITYTVDSIVYVNSAENVPASFHSFKKSSVDSANADNGYRRHGWKNFKFRYVVIKRAKLNTN